jgi:alanine racemase
MTRYRPTWVEISAAAFSSNIAALKKWVGPSVPLLAVLKANAYGHGARELASVAVKSGAALIGVSSLEEAVALRDAGITAPILLLGSIFPLENFKVALEHDLMPTVGSLESYSALKEMARRHDKSWKFHLKVDTGMGRIGVSVDEAKRILGVLAADKNHELAGVYSHLATADSDLDFAKTQLAAFNDLHQAAASLGFGNVPFHIANSAGIFAGKEFHLQMVRPGLALYGVPPSPLPSSVKLTPVLTWRTEIVFLKKVPAQTSISYGRTFITKRESVIATLPVGYADGVPRSVSGKGQVLIGGRRVPIVGRVTMDQIMVDVTDLAADGLSIKVGESVILLGTQNHDQISASDWAAWAGTIPYEILCGISARVPREMVKA